MVRFTAINEEPQIEAEKSTHEVLIENALKTYQSALAAQQAGNFALAERLYAQVIQSDLVQEELIDVWDEEEVVHELSEEEESDVEEGRDAGVPLPVQKKVDPPLPPLLLLRFLALKNYATFRLERLSKDSSFLPNQTRAETLRLALEDFTSALSCEDTDPSVWRSIAELAAALGSTKLERFAQESNFAFSVDVSQDVEEIKDLKVGPGGISAAIDLLGAIAPLDDGSADMRDALLSILKANKIKPPLIKVFKSHSWLATELALQSPPLAETLRTTQSSPLKVRLQRQTWAELGKRLLDAYHSAIPAPSISIEMAPSILSAEVEDVVESRSPEQPRRRSLVPTETYTDVVRPTDESPAATMNEPGSSDRKRRSSVDATAATRASKRARGTGVVVPAEEVGRMQTLYEQDLQFVISLNTILGRIDMSLGEPEQIGVQASTSSDKTLNEFRELLKRWTEADARAWSATGAAKKPDVTASDTSLFDLAAADPPRSAIGAEDMEGLSRFMEQAQEKGMAVVECCLAWLCALTRQNDAGVRSAYEHDGWDHGLKSVVTKVAITLEKHCLDLLKGSRRDVLTLSWAQTLYEIYLDAVMEEERGRKKEAPITDFTSRDRLVRWGGLVQDLLEEVEIADRAEVGLGREVELRYIWASTIFAQVVGAPHGDTLKRYEDIIATLEAEGQGFEIVLPNCHSLPKVSAAKANLEIQKFETMDYFVGIFQTSRDKNSTESIRELEAILLPSAASEGDHQMQLIFQFLESSSLEFRLYLWKVLEEAYSANMQAEKALECMFESLGLMVQEMQKDSAKKAAETERRFLLLRNWRVVQVVITRASNTVHNNPIVADFDGEKTVVFIGSLLYVLRLLLHFALYEDAVDGGALPKHGDAVFGKFRDSLRDLLVRSCNLLYFLLHRALNCKVSPSNTIPDLELAHAEVYPVLSTLLRVLHDELGSRSYCSLAGGMFLQLLEQELLRLDRPDDRFEFLQCLHCRYEMTMSMDNFHAFEHHAKPSKLERNDALRIAPFIMSSIRPTSTGEYIVRNDIKAALEQICQALAFPPAVTAVTVNKQIIGGYLESKIDPLWLSECRKGTLALSTMPVVSMRHEEAVRELYLLQARVLMTQHRLRAKQTQVKPTDDLVAARGYFMLDLSINPDRFDSWYGLAQTYSGVSDNELATSADNILKKYDEIVELQKKAILCYMMARSTSMRCHAVDPGYLQQFMLDFGQQLYIASREPTKMSAFIVDIVDWQDPSPTVADSEEASVNQGASDIRSINCIEKKMGKRAPIRLAADCLSIAKQLNPQDWRAPYMLGKCLERLGKQPELVLEQYVIACQVAPEKSPVTQELVIDPHYKLISQVFKYVWIKKTVSVEDGWKYLDYTRYRGAITAGEGEVNSYRLFFKQVYASLLTIKDADKKHWHHRPVYLWAKLNGEYGENPIAAKTELQHLFEKGSVCKIWRTEFERPGRHYVYNQRYTALLIKYASQSGDVDTLRAIAKKLRKGSATMTNHKEVWDYLCEKYLEALRHRCHFSVPSSLLQDSCTVEIFNQAAQALENAYSIPGVMSLEFDAMKDIIELKKLNAGFYEDVDVFDDRIIDIYCQLIHRFLPLQQPSAPAPVHAHAMSLSSIMTPRPSPAFPPVATMGMPFQVTVGMQAQMNSPSTPATPSVPQSAPAFEVADAKTTVKSNKVTRAMILQKAASLGKPKPRKVEKVAQIPESSLTHTVHQSPVAEQTPHFSIPYSYGPGQHSGASTPVREAPPHYPGIAQYFLPSPGNQGPPPPQQ